METFVKQTTDKVKYFKVSKVNENCIVARDLQTLQKVELQNGTFEIISKSLVPAQFL